MLLILLLRLYKKEVRIIEICIERKTQSLSGIMLRIASFLSCEFFYNHMRVGALALRVSKTRFTIENR
jgi:hypothetical protein